MTISVPTTVERRVCVCLGVGERVKHFTQEKLLYILKLKIPECVCVFLIIGVLVTDTIGAQLPLRHLQAVRFQQSYKFITPTLCYMDLINLHTTSPL